MNENHPHPLQFPNKEEQKKRKTLLIMVGLLTFFLLGLWLFFVRENIKRVNEEAVSEGSLRATIENDFQSVVEEVSKLELDSNINGTSTEKNNE